LQKLYKYWLFVPWICCRSGPNPFCC